MEDGRSDANVVVGARMEAVLDMKRRQQWSGVKWGRRADGDGR